MNSSHKIKAKEKIVSKTSFWLLINLKFQGIIIFNKENVKKQVKINNQQ